LDSQGCKFSTKKMADDGTRLGRVLKHLGIQYSCGKVWGGGEMLASPMGSEGVKKQSGGI